MRKIIPAAVAGAAALAVAGATFGYVTLDKDVQLSVDGASTGVSTMAGTVGEVLESKGIELGEHDVVAPAPETKLVDGTRIAVQYGRQIKVTVDGKPQTYWTTATNVDQALASLNIKSTGAQLSTSRSAAIGREGLSFNLATLKTITVDHAGTNRRIKTTAQTVGAALAAAKIRVDADDKVSVSEATSLTDGASFSVTRVDVTTVTRKKKVDFSTRYENSDDLDKGDTRVETEGKPGVRTITYTEVRHNGKLQSREKTSSKVSKAPRAEVVLRGTKEPEPEPQNDSADNSSNGNSENKENNDNNENGSNSDNNSSTPASGTVWDRLAQCESGQQWDINTGNGYYGGLQFSAQTWRAYGGSGMANNASRAEQIRIAKKVLADVGWQAWPACSSKLGLR